MKNIIKTVIAVLLAVALTVTLYACAANKSAEEAPSATEAVSEAIAQTEEAEEDGQNPVMNYIGKYDNGGCTILVEADGMNGAKFTVDFPMTDDEAESYTFSGEWEEDTLKVHYNNSTKKVLKLAADGTVTEEKTEYTDGSGEVVFHEDGTLEWKDENEAERFIDNYTFSYVYVTEQN